MSGGDLSGVTERLLSGVDTGCEKKDVAARGGGDPVDTLIQLATRGLDCWLDGAEALRQTEKQVWQDRLPPLSRQPVQEQDVGNAGERNCDASV